MSIVVNQAGVRRARSLISSGAVDRDSGWSFSAADGNRLLGDPPNWGRYGRHFLARDTTADDETRAAYKYPFAKMRGGRVLIFRSALAAIRVRAAQQGATEVFNAAGRLFDALRGTSASLDADPLAASIGTEPVDVRFEHEPESVVVFNGSQEGLPVKRFRKELIRIGDYEKRSEGLKFSVDRELLEHWATQHKRMTDNGVKVPVPATHHGSGDPDRNRGWVTDMFVEGESLYGILEMIGEDAIAAATRSDVSINSPSQFVDGEGNEYVRPITHVALCTDPVIPGLGKFVPLAASSAGEPKGVKFMNWSSVAEVLGLKKSEINDENAVKKITSAFEDRQALVLSMVEKATGVKGLTVENLESRLAEAKTKQESKQEPSDPDPYVLQLARENMRLKLDGLVEAGCIVPSVAKQLFDMLASPKALTLAHARGTVGEADEIVKILSQNDPVLLNGVSGPQVLKLADPMSADDNPLLAEVERRRKVAGM